MPADLVECVGDVVEYVPLAGFVVEAGGIDDEVCGAVDFRVDYLAFFRAWAGRRDVS